MAGTAEATKGRRPPRDASNIASGKRLLDTARVCDFLSIGDDTLNKLLDDPDEKFPVPVYVVKGKRHWTLNSIEAYVDRKEKQAKAEDRR